MFINNKMGKGRGGKGYRPGFGSGLIGGTVLGGSGGGGGGGALVGSCRSDDTTLYCRLSRFTSIISQIIYLLIIVYGIYMLFQYMKKK
jgi:hypothetical protein